MSTFNSGVNNNKMLQEDFDLGHEFKYEFEEELDKETSKKLLTQLRRELKPEYNLAKFLPKTTTKTPKTELGKKGIFTIKNLTNNVVVKASTRNHLVFLDTLEVKLTANRFINRVFQDHYSVGDKLELAFDEENDSNVRRTEVAKFNAAQGSCVRTTYEFQGKTYQSWADLEQAIKQDSTFKVIK
jgi:hypothetical protein